MRQLRLLALPGEALPEPELTGTARHGLRQALGRKTQFGTDAGEGVAQILEQAAFGACGGCLSVP